MKKLFSMAAIFTMALTLVACSTEDEVLVNELLFTFTDEYDLSSTETVTIEEGYEGDFKDLLILNFEFVFSETDFGTLLSKIEHLSPKTGAFVSISKNDVVSNVGIDFIQYEAGDSFDFSVVWWDTVQEGVDDLIQLFIGNHASDYVNSESVDFNVLLGLNLLGIASDYVSASEVDALVENSTLVTDLDYFKAIMMLNVVETDSSSLIAELNLIATPGPFGQTAFGLLAMDSISHTEDYSTFVSVALADFQTTTPFDLGLDAGGISLCALSNYSGVETLISDYTSWISSSQLDSGGVLTRDIIWGETIYPGAENASSMSQIILGLVANGIDPTGVEYTKGTNNLVSRLLEFTTDTGSFDYIEGDELNEDLAFSTPQGFLALVTYQVYANTFSAVNPYDFN